MQYYLLSKNKAMSLNKIGLVIILVSLLSMVLLVEDRNDKKVVGSMVGIFLLGTLARKKI